jgi:hypothetical protein
MNECFLRNCELTPYTVTFKDLFIFNFLFVDTLKSVGEKMNKVAPSSNSRSSHTPYMMLLHG